eukprot:COSAG01_NODE_16309_length_1247_cov_72.007840_1_plen_75_part_00
MEIIYPGGRLTCVGRYNYPIGLRGEVPEQIFLSLKQEFTKKLPFQMAYWEYDVNYKMRCGEIQKRILTFTVRLV